MKEMIKKSLGFWNNYWGDSVFPYLLAIALLYLLIFKRKKKTTRYVLGYVFLALEKMSTGGFYGLYRPHL